jgi:hypothetical protein
MNIAIDYDDTYTACPIMFDEIINTLSCFGHSIYIVTYRDSTQFDDIDMEIKHIRDYIFTSGTAKQKYCEDNGLKIDIWIDDSPDAICFDYKNLPIR